MDGLRSEGWSPTWCPERRAAAEMSATAGLRAVLVDLSVADRDVPAVLAAAYGGTRAPLPAVVLALRATMTRRISSLPTTAHDFVLHPTDPVEVGLRLQVLARRAQAVDSARPLVIDDLVLDEDARLVYRSGQAVFLTPTEFDLLHYLMRNPRRALSKRELLEEVWGFDVTQERDNVVELFISYLRKKLHGDLGEPVIHTVRGVGYLLWPLPARSEG